MSGIVDGVDGGGGVFNLGLGFGLIIIVIFFDMGKFFIMFFLLMIIYYIGSDFFEYIVINGGKFVIKVVFEIFGYFGVGMFGFFCKIEEFIIGDENLFFFFG